MKFESHAEEALLDEVGTAFGLAIGDVADDAQRRARVKTGRFRDSIQTTPVEVAGDRLESRVGSDLSSARAKEHGAFVRPQPPATVMRIPFRNGRFATVESFRIPATPAVEPAARRFPELMGARLREARR